MFLFGHRKPELLFQAPDDEIWNQPLNASP
jgi:hypothetical protein